MSPDPVLWAPPIVVLVAATVAMVRSSSWDPTPELYRRRRFRGVLSFAAIVLVILGGVLIFGWTDPPLAEPAHLPGAAVGRSSVGAGEESSGEGSSTGVADPETGMQLIRWSGNEQLGRPGTRLWRPLTVGVVDGSHQPLVGRAVRFEVARGGGKVDPDVVVTSDAGLATTAWTLGTRADSLAVRAYVADRPELWILFTARFQSDVMPPLPADEPARVAASPEPDQTADAGADDAVGPRRERAVEPVSPPASEARGRSSPPPSPAPSPTRSPPAAEASPAPAVSWAPGGVQTCRILSDRVTCWGAGGTRMLELDGAGGGSALSVGSRYVCGITAPDAVACRALSGDPAPTVAGVRRLPGGGPVRALGVGSDHVCALAGGRLYCWGANARGQLGTGGGEASEPVPVEGPRDVVRIAAGWFHSCALTAAGRIWCWGANDAGQVGVPPTRGRAGPAPLAGATRYRRITAGSAHTCGLDTGGEAWCWGDNRYGQAGVDGGTGLLLPRRVGTNLVFREITAGGVHTCALTRDGEAWCWGRNVFGQLGDGSTEDSPAPVRVTGELSFRAIAGGGAHTCAETVDGALYCWGNNVQGQLGDGTLENRTEPVRSGNSP